MKVRCINDKWVTNDPVEEKAPSPAFFDEDIVTEVHENENGVYYQLKKRFEPTSMFHADNFVVVDSGVDEKEIMPKAEVKRYIGELKTRRYLESEKRFDNSVKMLAGAVIIGTIGLVIMTIFKGK